MNLTMPQHLIYDSEKLIGGSVAVMCGILTVDKTYPEGQVVAAIHKIYETNDALDYKLDDSGSEPQMYYEAPRGRTVNVIRVNNISELDEIGRMTAVTAFDLNSWLSDLTAVFYPDGCGIIIKVHHLLGDAWSMSLIANQFIAALEGNPCLRYSYKEYVDTEKEYLKSKKSDRDRQFFIQAFKHCSEPVTLSDKQCDDYRSDSILFSLSTQKRASLLAYAERTGNSEFACLFSAFAVLCSKLKNCAELFFLGMPVLNRFSEAEMNTVGMFVNTVPVPINLDFDKSFADNLQQVQDSIFSVFKHQKFNYNAILKAVGEEFGFQGKLYDCSVNYQPDVVVSGQTTRTKIVNNEMQAENLQLILHDRDRESGLVMEYFYRRSVFQKESIIRFHEMLMRVLDTLLADDELPLREISILGKAEKEQLHLFNDTSVFYDKTKSIYDLFAEQAKKNGQARIRDEKGEYTFSQLDKDASEIDAYIRKTVGTDKQVIGVMCDRSYDELAAIFGIVRGGNAYMPISPQYPAERIQTMLETSGCKLVIAQKQYADKADCAVNIENILSQPSDTIPEPAAKPDDTLYVIYTSGSTGTPKGAMVSNSSAINRIGWMADKYFDHSTVVMRKTPYTFDVSVWEIFGFAMYGFSLYILPPEAHYNQNEVLDCIEKGQVTDLHFVPTVFEQFISVLRQRPDADKKLGSLRSVILSGESLHAKDVNEFKKYLGGKIAVHNLYGPAECAVDVTGYECNEAEADPIPIGKPIANTQIYIVDRYMQPVPIGVTGELCIAGDNVGQGYLNRPELTKEKFVDNPFGEGKLYRTGDLAYWREDGNIIFVGRNDFQIKINGQRVELGEIESALSSVDGVDSAAVIVRKDSNDNQLLCAFYTGKEMSATDLRSVLGRSLPRYMVPQSFSFLDSMPLNASGKIDRKAFDAYPVEPIAEAYEEPGTATEKEICELFGSVLGVERVGRNDNFYDLGGTSLQLVQLLSSSLLEALSPSDFMTDPTPAGVAKKLDARNETDYNYVVPLYVAENSEKAVVLFPYAGGDASAYTALVAKAREENSDISLYCVDWYEDEALSDIENEIRKLATEKNVWFYSHCAGCALALNLLDRINDKEKRIRGYIAGAVIPPGRVFARINVWKYMTDNAIAKLLIRAGMEAGAETMADLQERVHLFRRQTLLFNRYFCNKTEKTNTTVTAIISKKDILTPNRALAKQLWQKAVSDVNGVVYIDTPTHYFQNTDAGFLLDLFNRLINGGN